MSTTLIAARFIDQIIFRNQIVFCKKRKLLIKTFELYTVLGLFDRISHIKHHSKLNKKPTNLHNTLKYQND